MNITKRFHFNAAHRLKEYDGVCNNIHGHNFRVEITVSGPDDNPMILDFKTMNQAKDIVNKFRDHSFIYEKGDQVAEALIPFGMKMYMLLTPPTTEMLCKELYNLLQVHTDRSALVTKIRIEETASCFAEYFPK